MKNELFGYQVPADMLVSFQKCPAEVARGAKLNGAYHAAVEAVAQSPNEWLQTTDSPWLLNSPEWQGHVARYSVRVSNVIQAWARKHSAVHVCTPPIGGIAPLDSVKRVITSQYEGDNIDFGVVDTTKSSSLLMDRKSTLVMVDDGLGSLSDQVKLLRTVDRERAGMWERLRGEMKDIQGRAGLGDASLRRYYERIIEGLHNLDILSFPIMSRNERFMQVLSDYVGDHPDEWSAAQSIVLDEKVCFPIPEDPLTVGGMINDIPCRDVGVGLFDLQENGTVSPRTIEILHREGLGGAEYRLLSNTRGLVGVSEKGRHQSVVIFSRKLEGILHS
ncbi:hypothetical protein HY468_05845 [Candidatus Roizmanbacteria bacterium]|nr:hypothetical protein [Candidatus Roizmanbacteria bacterium]